MHVSHCLLPTLSCNDKKFKSKTEVIKMHEFNFSFKSKNKSTLQSVNQKALLYAKTAFSSKGFKHSANLILAVML